LAAPNHSSKKAGAVFEKYAMRTCGRMPSAIKPFAT
jgi:hypothetical protein